MINISPTILEAIKRQRVSFACAIMAAFVLIWIARAPAIPVIAGCSLAIAYLTFKSWSKLSGESDKHH